MTEFELMELLKEHRCEIVDDFLKKDLHAECSCGWTGEKAPSQMEALADYAAHVHVTLGWAEQ